MPAAAGEPAVVEPTARRLEARQIENAGRTLGRRPVYAQHGMAAATARRAM